MRDSTIGKMWFLPSSRLTIKDKYIRSTGMTAMRFPFQRREKDKRETIRKETWRNVSKRWGSKFLGSL